MLGVYRVLKMLNRVLLRMFLRFYGFNLGRSKRNSAGEACSDAIMNMIIILSSVFICVPLIALSQFLPNLQGNIKGGTANFILLVFLLIVPISIWLNKKFKGYEKSPEMADSYRAPLTRVMTVLFLLLFPVICVTVTGLVLHATLS